MRRRRGAMASNPPLRGQARRDFRQAQREAVASGGPAPTQDQFRPRPRPQQFGQQQRIQAPQAGQNLGQVAQDAGMTGGGQVGQQIGQIAQGAGVGAGQAIGGAVNAPGQMPPDKMYRFPGFDGAQGAALGAAMGNLAGSRQEGSPLAQQYMQQQQQQQPKRPPVFNAFPGNNPANLNDANIGRFDNMRYLGGSATFNENPNDMARPAVMPDNYSNQQQQQFLQALQQARQGGQVQDGMFRSPGVPMRNIPGIEPAIQPGAYMPQMRRR